MTYLKYLFRSITSHVKNNETFTFLADNLIIYHVREKHQLSARYVRY